jgi:hypothetical protein
MTKMIASRKFEHRSGEKRWFRQPVNSGFRGAPAGYPLSAAMLATRGLVDGAGCGSVVSVSSPTVSFYFPAPTKQDLGIRSPLS